MIEPFHVLVPAGNDETFSADATDRPAPSCDAQSPNLDRLHADIVACRACERAGHIAEARPIRHPWTPAQRTMIVGQAPGALTHAQRYHFAGPGGALLERWFERAGFAPGTWRDRCYITSMTRCFPGKSPRGNGDRRPSTPELALCRPFLEAELRLVRPRLIVPVGSIAIDYVLGRYGLGRRPLNAVVGRAFELDGRMVLPLPHPSGVSRWLNAPAHRELVERAIGHLRDLRLTLDL